MNLVIEIAFAALLLLGGGFMLLGSYGLAKLSDFYKRLHGPTKATTLGIGSVLVATVLHHAFIYEGLPTFREVLISLFLFLTAPVSAYLMAKSTLTLAPQARPPMPRHPGEISAEFHDGESIIRDRS